MQTEFKVICPHCRDEMELNWTLDTPAEKELIQCLHCDLYFMIDVKLSLQISVYKVDELKSGVTLEINNEDF